MKSFSTTESHITKLFTIGRTFIYNKVSYKIIDSGKPSPSKGECKTDTYILTEGINNKTKEFKISIKQENADFLENKMSKERASQIFGKNYKNIVTNSLINIKGEFLDDYLVTFNRYGKTEEKTLKIGWKFELVNKKGGKKSGMLQLTQNQLFDIYAGTNLDNSKRDSKVNGKIIKDSGIANFIFIAKKDKKYKCQEIINSMVPIRNYIKNKKIFFACKAINFRVLKNKWDGNRPLAVFVNWELKNGLLYSEIIMNKPLENKANMIGNNIRLILNTLKINENNFMKLKKVLTSTKYYES